MVLSLLLSRSTIYYLLLSPSVLQRDFSLLYRYKRFETQKADMPFFENRNTIQKKLFIVCGFHDGIGAKKILGVAVNGLKNAFRFSIMRHFL